MAGLEQRMGGGQGPCASRPQAWRLWGDPLTLHIPLTLAGPTAGPGPRPAGGVDPGWSFSWAGAGPRPGTPRFTSPPQNLVHRVSGPEGLWGPCPGAPLIWNPVFPEGSSGGPSPPWVGSRPIDGTCPAQDGALVSRAKRPPPAGPPAPACGPGAPPGGQWARPERPRGPQSTGPGQGLPAIPDLRG